MSKTAKFYVTLVIASGMALLLLAAGSWSSLNMRQFVIYLDLAALASVLGDATIFAKPAAQSTIIKGE